MSVLMTIASKIASAEAFAKESSDEDEQARARFEALTFRRALVLLEPVTIAEAAVHARAVYRLVGALTVETLEFARLIAPLPAALDAVIALLEDAANPRAEAGSGIIACAANELEKTHQKDDNRLLVSRGDALERAILTAEPHILEEAAIVVDVVLRWARDLPPQDGADVTLLEGLERGLEALANGLSRLCGRPVPEDRPSFAAMLVNNALGPPLRRAA